MWKIIQAKVYLALFWYYDTCKPSMSPLPPTQGRNLHLRSISWLLNRLIYENSADSWKIRVRWNKKGIRMTNKLNESQNSRSWTNFKIWFNSILRNSNQLVYKNSTRYMKYSGVWQKFWTKFWRFSKFDKNKNWTYFELWVAKELVNKIE